MTAKRFLAAGWLTAAAILAQAASLHADQSASVLKLYMPREATVKDNSIRLGDIAIASGDESLVRKAGDIRLGSISIAGQQVIINRYTIVTRLGSSGIDTSRVDLSGSENITVTLHRKSVTSAELLVAAERFALRFPLPPDQRLHALDVPADVNVGEFTGKLEVVPSLQGQPKDNPVKVGLIVIHNGKELARRDVRFAPVPRNARLAVAAAGTTAAKPAVAAKTPVAADSPKVVFRNQPVTIEVDMPGLRVTSIGLPLEDGRAGQFIKIRNLDSKRDIIARVKADGTVSPVL
jgi:flagella basal body P-ring formation protein FlgA